MIDVKVISVEIDSDEDAPCILWLWERGYECLSPMEISDQLVEIPEIVDGWPVFKREVPASIVTTVSSDVLDPIAPKHYWVYRFHESRSHDAMLYKLTFGVS